MFNCLNVRISSVKAKVALLANNSHVWLQRNHSRPERGLLKSMSFMWLAQIDTNYTHYPESVRKAQPLC